MVGWIDERIYMDVQISGCVDRWMDGRIEWWMDGGWVRLDGYNGKIGWIEYVSHMLVCLIYMFNICFKTCVYHMLFTYFPEHVSWTYDKHRYNKCMVSRVGWQWYYVFVTSIEQWSFLRGFITVQWNPSIMATPFADLLWPLFRHGHF